MSYWSFWTYFTPFSNASIVNFEEVFICWVFTSLLVLYVNRKWKTSFFAQCNSLTYDGLIFIFVSKLRSSRLHIFFKIGALKYFANFAGKHLCRSLILIKLLACSPKKRLKHRYSPVEFSTSEEHLFYRKPPVAASESFPLFCSHTFRITESIITEAATGGVL